MHLESTSTGKDLLLLRALMELNSHVYQNMSQHLPRAPVAPPPTLSPGQGTATFRKYHYGCNSNYRYRQVTTTVCSKTLLLLLLLRNKYLGNTVDQGQEL